MGRFGNGYSLLGRQSVKPARVCKLSSEGRPVLGSLPCQQGTLCRAPGQRGLAPGCAKCQTSANWVLTLPRVRALVLFEDSCVGACGQCKVELFGRSLSPSRGERSVGQSGVTRVTWRCHLHRGAPPALFKPCPSPLPSPPFLSSWIYHRPQLPPPAVCSRVGSPCFFPLCC